ncbi:MAG TPA: winged helix DNA-binding domain-containing protein [Actinomycetota bacterium]
MDVRAVAKTRIGNSRLSGDPFATPAEAVGWHLAMQSQDYAPASWSVGQRSRGLTAADVDAALAEGSIVRTHVLRPTWHFVAAEDVRWLLALSGPRVLRAHAGRFAQLGLDGRSLSRGERVVVRALSEHGRLTRRQLGEALDRAGFDRSDQRMAWLLSHCELRAVIGSGGLDGKQQTYALLDGRVPDRRPRDREEALVELTRRYLRSHGPASVRDLSWWSGMTMGDLRTALADLGDAVRSEPVDGVTLWWSADAPGRPRAPRRPHLLQTYDELVVGYTETRFLGDPNRERARAAWGDRTLPSGGLLVGDRIAGHWRRSSERERIRIEVITYDRPDQRLRAALERAARAHGTFFDRPTDLDVRTR